MGYRWEEPINDYIVRIVEAGKSNPEYVFKSELGQKIADLGVDTAQTQIKQLTESYEALQQPQSLHGRAIKEENHYTMNIRRQFLSDRIKEIQEKLREEVEKIEENFYEPINDFDRAHNDSSNYSAWDEIAES